MAAVTVGLAFVTWDRTGPSGGNTYNRALVDALVAAGAAVDVRALPGSWPSPGPPDRRELARVLDAHPVSLVDGIVASGAPDAVEAAVAAGRRVVVLVHMATADEVGPAPGERSRREEVEGRALRAASAVVATSLTAADDLVRRHGLTARADGAGGHGVPAHPRPTARRGPVPVHVARPGAAPAPLARGSTPPRILAVANHTPTKDPVTLVRALELVADLGWTASLVGSSTIDPDYAANVRREVADRGLAGRVLLPGALEGAELEAQWAAADLLVLPSRTETFGLVVLEALAHGLPAVVSAGTGAVEALGVGSVHDDGGGAGRGDVAPALARTPDARLHASGVVSTARRVNGSSEVAGLAGCAVPPGDPIALAAVLRTWLTDPDLRRSWRHNAAERRRRLPGWDATAAAVLEALS